MPQSIDSVDTLLLWLTSVVGSTAALSFFLSFIPTFSDLPGRTQTMIRIGTTLAIALLARFLIDFIPPDIKLLIAPYVTVAGVVIGSAYAAQRAGQKGAEVAEVQAVNRGIARDHAEQKRGGAR